MRQSLSELYTAFQKFKFDCSFRFSLSMGETWQPTIYIGNLSSGNTRVEPTSQWFDVGGYGAISGVTHATQTPPESIPAKITCGIGTAASSGSEVVPQQLAAHSVGERHEGSKVMMPMESSQGSAKDVLLGPTDARSARPYKNTARDEGNRMLQRRHSMNPAGNEPSSLVQDDGSRSSRAMCHKWNERRSSRSPSRHHFDKHDDAVFTHESPSLHDRKNECQSDLTAAKRASTQASPPPTEKNMSKTHQIVPNTEKEDGLNIVAASAGRVHDMRTANQYNFVKASSKSADRLFCLLPASKVAL